MRSCIAHCRVVTRESKLAPSCHAKARESRGCHQMTVDGYPEKVDGLYGDGKYFVYILRLFDDHWYIGQTEAPKRRILHHIRGSHTSPQFVKAHPPVAVESVLEYDSRERAMERERDIAEAFANYYGLKFVRGGGL